MNKTKRPFRFRIGMRNIKTAIAATLCAIGYLTANVIFDTSFDPTFACIGAIFGTGSDMGDSWLNGGNRLFGTIIGGVIGMLMFRLYLFWQPGGEWSFKILPFMFVGVVALIIACQFFRWPGGIQPGGDLLADQPVAHFVGEIACPLLQIQIDILQPAGGSEAFDRFAQPLQAFQTLIFGHGSIPQSSRKS